MVFGVFFGCFCVGCSILGLFWTFSMDFVGFVFSFLEDVLCFSEFSYLGFFFGVFLSLLVLWALLEIENNEVLLQYDGSSKSSIYIYIKMTSFAWALTKSQSKHLIV